MTQNKHYYTLSLASSFALTLVGMVLHRTTNPSIEIWSAPLNIMLLFSIVVVGIAFSLYYRKTKAYRFFTNTHTTLGALTGFVCLLIILGITPQLNIHEVNEEIGWGEMIYRRLTTSLPFSLNLIYILFILLLVILKRRFTLNLRYISFQFNHIGLWLALSAGLFGASDKKEHKILLEPNKVIQNGFTLKGETQRLPFSFILNDFSIERYPDKLLLLAKNKDEVEEKGECEIHTYSSEYTIGDICFKASYNMDNHIIVELKDTIEILKRNRSLIEVGDNMVLYRNQGKAKHYSATLSFEYKKEMHREKISVNNPIIIDDYYIYLESFDYKEHYDTPNVVLRLVKDPWIVVAYIGLWMIIIGALLLIIVGPITQNNANQNKLRI
ncbi:MAG: cytochrome c biogenesis protein ResB [Bacteroidales bacterium]